jgi:hypothetical protein
MQSTLTFLQKLLQSFFAPTSSQDKLWGLTIFLVIWLSVQAILRLGMDIFLEFFGLLGLGYAPIRLDFLSLVGLSALLALQNLTSLKSGNFELKSDTLSIAIILELGLLISDFYFMFSYLSSPENVIIRLPFVFVTALNLGLLLTTFWVFRSSQNPR